MAAETITPVFGCAQCGATFSGRKRKYCSRGCCTKAGWTRALRKKHPRLWGEYVAEVSAKALKRTCPQCGETFRPNRYDGHIKGPQIHCSVACKVAKKASDRKIKLEQSKLHKLLTEIKWGKISQVRRCTCGKFIQPTRYTRQCDECRQHNAIEAKRRAKRVQKAKERARLRAARVEAVDPIAVFERDDWRCYICGSDTPRELRGTYEPNAPELEHIIPLSRGGEHSMRNTACACRKCNSEKGARPLEQLRLVA